MINNWMNNWIDPVICNAKLQTWKLPQNYSLEQDICPQCLWLYDCKKDPLLKINCFSDWLLMEAGSYWMKYIIICFTVYFYHDDRCGYTIPGMRGAEHFPARRGGTKKHVNRLIQKFDKSALIVSEIFVVCYDGLKKENIMSSHLFLQRR